MAIEGNSISKLENLPVNLYTLDCGFNNITKIENLPLVLINLWAIDKPIDYVDDIRITDVAFTLKGYQAIRRLQRRIKIRHK